MSAWIHNNQIRINGAIPSCDGIDIGAEDGDNIAIVLFDRYNHTMAEVRERANLICAAPALYEALVNLIRMVEDCDNIHLDQAKEAVKQAGEWQK